MKRILFTLISMVVMTTCMFAQGSKAINEEAMLNSINELRSYGCVCVNNVVKSVPTVKWDKRLADIALDYANHLKNNNPDASDPYMFMSHVGMDGSTVASRLADADYIVSYAIENIAYVHGNEELAIDFWLNNPQSCNNLMEKKVTMMGAARSGDFWVLIMAQPTGKTKRDKAGAKESKEEKE